MTDTKKIMVGIICLLFAFSVYTTTGSAINNTTINNTTDDVVPGGINEAQGKYQSNVHIESSYGDNPIHPALTEDGDIMYNDIDFFIYSENSQSYRISIYVNSLEDPHVIEGDTSFKAKENFLVPEGVKKIKKIVVEIGPHSYKYEDVKIMHRGIDEDKAVVDDEETVSKQDSFLNALKSFIAGVFASIVFAFGFWRFWKNHLEHEVQDVV